jgi:hypothetical protein
MKQNLTPQDVTPEVIEAGYAYIAALAATQTTAEIVKPIYATVLAGFEFYNDVETERERSRPRRRITDPNDLYLSMDEEQVSAYYAAADKALRENGIKPEDMPAEHCPLLVAEHNQTKAEWALIEAAARMLDDDKPEEFNNKLLCQPQGLEKRKQFIELVAKLVVNLPGEKEN